MATLSITPPYDASFSDRLLGAGGRINSLKAEAGTGKLEVSVGSTADPGIPLKTQSAALAAVGVLVDTPPGTRMTVETVVSSSLNLSLHAVNAEAESMGYCGMLVLELDAQLRPVAIPLFRRMPLWTIHGYGATLNFQRDDRLAGSFAIVPARLYRVWVWIAGDVQIEEDPGGSPNPNGEFGTFLLATKVPSIELTAS
jgi:hypothetical protein